MRWSRRIRRRSGVEVAAVAASVALVAAVAGLPWHRSGSVTRRGFELARAAERAGLVSGAGHEVLRVAVYLLPLLAALAFLAAAADRPVLSGCFSCTSGAVGLASVLVVTRVDGGRQVGPLVALAAGGVAVACGLHLIRRARRVGQP